MSHEKIAFIVISPSGTLLEDKKHTVPYNILYNIQYYNNSVKSVFITAQLQCITAHLDSDTHNIVGTDNTILQ